MQSIFREAEPPFVILPERLQSFSTKPELEKFGKVTLADGQVMTTEMTKKQRLILQALKIM